MNVERSVMSVLNGLPYSYSSCSLKRFMIPMAMQKFLCKLQETASDFADTLSMTYF